MDVRRSVSIEMQGKVSVISSTSAISSGVFTVALLHPAGAYAFFYAFRETFGDEESNGEATYRLALKARNFEQGMPPHATRRAGELGRSAAKDGSRATYDDAEPV